MHRFRQWQALSDEKPTNLQEVLRILLRLRAFTPIDQLVYGDHGLVRVREVILDGIRTGKRFALYADYDVDGTMSCVSWIWFFRAIGYGNFVHYIPCRFKEGYGVNLEAIKKLIAEEGADIIITMDTGITANEEAAYCREHGVQFICTDHHKIQSQKMPDCLILNPKQHPDPAYQELCGCGVTFVLLRKLGEALGLKGEIWRDLLALTGMATICDVVPLNPVNHRLARQGVQALTASQRPILRQLMRASEVGERGVDEQDVGFRLGPRINAVGRLNHADAIIHAFIEEEPGELISFMERCNEERRAIQDVIVEQALAQAAAAAETPILFLGHPDWHPGVIGIAASKIAEKFWRPTWLFQRMEDGNCKGSARSIPGFDVTDAMGAAAALFTKFGGHQAAGGFTFPVANEEHIRAALTAHAARLRIELPAIWSSSLTYDCPMPLSLLSLELVSALDELRPFGMGFPQPRFYLQGELVRVRHLNDKKTFRPKHSRLSLRHEGRMVEIMMFQEVVPTELQGSPVAVVVEVSRNHYQGRQSLSLIAVDLKPVH